MFLQVLGQVVDTVIVTPCPTKECVGFMADSGMFAMVRGH